MPFSPPVTLSNLLEGVVRFVYAPYSVARPTKLDDIMTLATPHALKAGWLDGGATSDSSSYERDMDSSEREIEQSTSAVVSRITSVDRAIAVPLAEITPALMQLTEAAPDPTVIAAGAVGTGTPAQLRVDFGSIGSLPRYRTALIAQQTPEYSSGEGGARGKFVAVVLYAASISADGSELEFGRDDGAVREISLTGFPDAAVADSAKNVGAFMFETGATLP